MKVFEIFDKGSVIRLFQKVAVAILVFLFVVTSANKAGVEKGIRLTEAKYEAEALEREQRERELAKQLEIDRDIVFEAEACARVLYGTARDNDPADQKAVVWCIINRCESAYYPDTIQEVCAQDKQWMGYSDSNPVVESLYELAKGELEIWHNGGYRPITPDYIYMSWSASEVTLRTSFIDSKSTRYWTPER